MGARMAGRLIAHGCAVHGVDPSPQARAQAEGLGVDGVEDLAAVPRCDVVLVMVATGDQLRETVRAGIRRGVRGEVWVICSTVGPQSCREATAALTDAGAAVLDAPVTGGIAGASNGALNFLVAGDPSAIRNVDEVLSALGTVTPVGRRCGDGQSTKIVNQLCSSVHLAAAAEAIALAARLGLDPASTVEVLSRGLGVSPFFSDRGPRMAQLDVAPAVLTRLAILAKDNGLVEQEADACGAHVPLLKAAKSQYLRASELDLLECDDSQIIRTYLN
ncbi:NAD(P)-dependent oxidoreductase [Pseudonocardia kujensis]|nr:NAD(P)-dependent oxidoreductase [Pseudonocardia kujensis]